MSVARGSQNAGHYYSNITMPQEVDLTFVVNPTDSGGLGITGLQSNGWVRYVFMHTSATPGVIDGTTNPNPANGIVAISFKQNFNVYLGTSWCAQCTVTGGALTSVTQGTVYQIVTVGTTTAAQWATAGLPLGFVPAVGQSFVAAVTGSLGGNGTVKAMGVPGFDNFSVMGLVNSTIANSNIASYGGAYIVGQFILAGSLAAPTAGTTINLNIHFDRSSVTIDGL